MLTFILRRALACLPLLIAQPAISQASFQNKSFEVVSIRQNVSQKAPSGSTSFVPGPDGFRVEKVPLVTVLLTAYTPKSSSTALFGNNIENLPDWARQEKYDIDARISDADRAAWKDPKNQPAMLRSMLQTMLADRFKLVVHRETKEVSAYDLVVAKGGPKMKETTPDEPRPAGTVLPGGGVMMPYVTPTGGPAARFYNLPMDTLASFLTSAADHEVINKTGLTGRYDFSIPKPASMRAPSAGADANAADADPSIFEVLQGLGLKLEPAKEQVEMLVIDHLEKPTEN
ncbi:MAG TPA: TIGR03435 family protein [Acidobacteriaceae bacterium]|nr:TIGR03435 family protein [Acidobacteriaceae bacterium]